VVSTHPVVLMSVSSSILSGGLHSLLRSSCQSAQVVQTQDPAEMPQMVRDLQPLAVMLDTALYGADIPATIAAAHESCGHARCVVLVDNAQQIIEAEKAGADLTVLKGFPAQKLAAALSTLCQESGAAN
jgi:DNA-binding NarL/FixJ family response regulator